MDPSVYFARLVTVIIGLETHVKSKGQFRLTRTAKPSLLLTIAQEYTGIKYPNNRNGQERAINDLRVKKEELSAEAMKF